MGTTGTLPRRARSGGGHWNTALRMAFGAADWYL